ncbi:MAG: phosphoadenylyl-sulfate reductase [bacterium]
MAVKESILSELLLKITGKSAVDSIRIIHEAYPSETVFSTSFGIEDQVIIDMIAKAGIRVNIFTLDTGRLFPETYSLWSSTMEKYGVKINAYSPDADTLNEFLAAHGPNAFYNSVELRKTCCDIRKVRPLRKALAGNKIWITGIRAEQSPNRDGMQMLEWDEVNQIIKFHPLLNWSYDEVKAYVSTNHVPYNPLHDRGFVSIGCAPCTRAINEGEDFRAGRWWWEDNSKKECGLHSHNKH